MAGLIVAGQVQHSREQDANRRPLSEKHDCFVAQPTLEDDG